MNQITGRYIVDIKDYGRRFQYDLYNILDQANPELNTNIKFIYEQSIIQIVMILSHNWQDFITKLNVLPQMEVYAHIYDFTNVDNRLAFNDIFKRFALGIAFCINHSLNKDLNPKEYLLERVSDTYIVVDVIQNYEVLQNVA